MPNPRCVTIGYIPSADAYAIRGPGGANATTVFVVSSGGTLITSFTTPAPFTLLPGQPGDIGVAGFDNVLRTYDAGGTLVDEDPIATGSLLEPFGLAAGPGGRYAVTDPNDSEVALFGP